MIKEDRLCKLRKRLHMRLCFNTEISIGETKVILKVVKLPQYEPFSSKFEEGISILARHCCSSKWKLLAFLR